MYYIIATYINTHENRNSVQELFPNNKVNLPLPHVFLFFEKYQSRKCSCNNVFDLQVKLMQCHISHVRISKWISKNYELGNIYELESLLRSKQVLIKFQVGKFPIKLEIIQLQWEFSNFNESFPTWMLTFQLIDIFNKKQPPFPVRKWSDG